MLCLQCKKVASVRKSSFCTLCNRKNLYRRNKLKAIQLKGGKCQLCHYDRCLAALDFHHIRNGEDKEFAISQHLHNWKKVLPELEKCILLCKNCHVELHEINNVETTYLEENQIYDFVMDNVEIK
jgi:5-methylcytosine-specific restriction endonuclease McrA